MTIDMARLHKKFKDDKSPTVAGQIRWLQKRGFTPDQIDKAMLAVYTELNNDKLPVLWTRPIKNIKGKNNVEVTVTFGDQPTGPNWTGREIENGQDLDKALLLTAKKFRTEDLTLKIKQLEDFESNLKSKWKAEILNQVPWYKRWFQKKKVLKEAVK